MEQYLGIRSTLRQIFEGEVPNTRSNVSLTNCYWVPLNYGIFVLDLPPRSDWTQETQGDVRLPSI